MRRFILPYVDEWALWTVRKHVFEAEGEVWVELDNIPDLTAKPDALVHLLYELRRLEWTLQHDGISGWISANRKTNRAMRRVILAIGAKPYREDAEFEYFYKLAGHPPLPARVLDCFRTLATQPQVTHGTA